MKIHFFVIIGLILFTASACYEKEEGCIDAAAVNFDVTADENCCCDYPKLVLNMNHTYGGAGLSYGANYSNNLNSPFKIIDIDYYLSAFALEDIDGNQATVTNQKSFTENSGSTISLTNDFVLMDEWVFVNIDTLGLFSDFGSYEKLSLTFGANGADSVNPTLIDSDHALAIQTDSMWFENDHYVVAKVILKPDTFATTSDTLTLTLFDEINVTLENEFEINRGTHINLNLQANYERWFDDIDFENDSVQEISSKISSNLASSLSFL